MGLIDKLLKIFGVKKDGAKVVCVGLDNSGKTTLLNKLKKDKEQQVYTYVRLGACNFSQYFFIKTIFSTILYLLSDLSAKNLNLADSNSRRGISVVKVSNYKCIRMYLKLCLMYFRRGLEYSTF